MRTVLLRLLALLILALSTGQAVADNWNVVRLRGQVLQLIEGAWQPLNRGDIVPDDRVLRTLGNGHAALVRGEETIELSPNTQIRIFDQGGAKPFTTVQQHFGTVSIEAEVRDVQHFAVQTQFLAAVVKGTRFTVTSGKSGAEVAVQRGHVQVDDIDERTTTILAVDQQAEVRAGGGMTVSGKGKLPPVVPTGSAAAKAMQAALAAEDAAAALARAKASGDPKAIAKAQQELKKAHPVVPKKKKKGKGKG